MSYIGQSDAASQRDAFSGECYEIKVALSSKLPLRRGGKCWRQRLIRIQVALSTTSGLTLSRFDSTNEIKQIGGRHGLPSLPPYMLSREFCGSPQVLTGR